MSRHHDSKREADLEKEVQLLKAENARLKDCVFMQERDIDRERKQRQVT